MRVLKVQPKSVVVTFEIELNDIINLVHALNVSTIDPKTERELAGDSFLRNTFFPVLNELTEESPDAP